VSSNGTALNDPRDEATRARDREIWYRAMGQTTPDELMDTSAFMTPRELVAMVMLVAAHSQPLPPLLREVKLEDIADSLERTLRYEATRCDADSGEAEPS
jgi:hypothetical protein